MDKDNFDTWANWYDELYSEKIQENDDLDFYRQFFEEKPDGKYLELACGTGRLYLQYLEQGYDIHGLDISENMLDQLKSKAKAEGLEPVVFREDAADFDLNEDYDVIYYPFSAFIHHSELKKQIDCINCIYEHLKKDGIFALDMPVFDFETIANYGEIMRKESEVDGTRYAGEYWSELTNQTEQKYEMTQRRINEETGEILFQTTFELGIIPKNQLELLLINAGFEEYNFYDGFDMSETDSETDRITLVARK